MFLFIAGAVLVVVTGVVVLALVAALVVAGYVVFAMIAGAPIPNKTGG